MHVFIFEVESIQETLLPTGGIHAGFIVLYDEVNVYTTAFQYTDSEPLPDRGTYAEDTEGGIVLTDENGKLFARGVVTDDVLILTGRDGSRFVAVHRPTIE